MAWDWYEPEEPEEYDSISEFVAGAPLNIKHDPRDGRHDPNYDPNTGAIVGSDKGYDLNNSTCNGY